MALRMEWRSRKEGDDTILVVEEGSNAVVNTWSADTDLLADFLNDMTGLGAPAPTGGPGAVLGRDRILVPVEGQGSASGEAQDELIASQVGGFRQRLAPA